MDPYPSTEPRSKPIIPIVTNSSDYYNSGIQDEHVLLLVFRSLNFDPRVVSVAACVSRRLRAVARRVLWRELCISRAPRVSSSISSSSDWHAVAKLLLFCCGSPDTGVSGHSLEVSRFSKTSGRSFLHPRCSSDVLFLSDPCEHSVDGSNEDLGVYRGVFGGFMRSRTRAWLISRGAVLDKCVRCPYCGARVWSMSAARMVPKSASRRLGTRDEGLDYFVCVKGHLHGNCWLAHLSDDDRDPVNEDEDEDEDEEEVG